MNRALPFSLHSLFHRHGWMSHDLLLQTGVDTVQGARHFFSYIWKYLLDQATSQHMLSLSGRNFYRLRSLRSAGARG